MLKEKAVNGYKALLNDKMIKKDKYLLSDQYQIHASIYIVKFASELRAHCWPLLGEGGSPWGSRLTLRMQSSVHRISRFGAQGPLLKKPFFFEEREFPRHNQRKF